MCIDIGMLWGESKANAIPELFPHLNYQYYTKRDSKMFQTRANMINKNSTQKESVAVL